jgi:hypothetical protein
MPDSEVSLEAPVVGERYYKMLYTARSIFLTSTEAIWVRWLFSTELERSKALAYLRNQFVHRDALELRTDENKLAILMRYRGAAYLPRENGRAGL